MAAVKAIELVALWSLLVVMYLCMQIIDAPTPQTHQQRNATPTGFDIEKWVVPSGDEFDKGYWQLLVAAIVLAARSGFSF